MRDLAVWCFLALGMGLVPSARGQAASEPERFHLGGLEAAQGTSPSLEAPPAPSDAAGDDWHFSLTPHLWLPAQSGTSKVKGIGGDVGTTIGDTLDATNYAAFVSATARRGRWTIGSYFQISDMEDDDSVGPLKVESESTWVVVDLVAGYQVLEHHMGPDGGQELTLGLFGGLRYQSLEAGIEIAPLVDVDDQYDWLEPVVGIDVGLKVAENFHWHAARASFSGFGIGSASNLTMSFYTGAAVDLSPSCQLQLGYRLANLDYSRGSGANRFSQDLQLGGPVIGVTFNF